MRDVARGIERLLEQIVEFRRRPGLGMNLGLQPAGEHLAEEPHAGELGAEPLVQILAQPPLLPFADGDQIPLQPAALDVLRPANGVTMPAVYSGHNGFWFWGPPPESATDAIIIGNFSPAELATGYAHCKVAGTVQTPPGVDNDLAGTPIHRCTGLRQPWSVLWPQAATFA